MEEYEIGSKLTINGNQFEIIDLWLGNKLIKRGKENVIIDVEYVNLKGKNGNILGPVELDISD
jgi:hypothetical protein